MITITPKAREVVLEEAKKENIKNIFLRIGLIGGGCSGFTWSIILDVPKDNDHKFEYEGLTIVVDPMSMMYIDGTEIDYVETLAASGFKFNNPNLKATCGCGASVAF